jgi:hypothetical protein
MSKDLYRYEFAEDVRLEEAEASLLLALFGVESLHGEAQVKRDAAHAFDQEQRCCVIDASSAVGRDLNRLFAGFLAREFGRASFRVERIAGASAGAGELASAGG